MSLCKMTGAHLHDLVQELGVGKSVALDTQHLLERVHFDAAVRDLLNDALEPVPQHGCPLSGVAARLRLLARAGSEPDRVRRF